MNVIESLSKSFSRLLESNDDLSRIEKEDRIEVVLNKIHKNGYLDTELFIDLCFAGVPFLQYLMKYKNITSDEAKALITYQYISFEDMIKILEFGINS